MKLIKCQPSAPDVIVTCYACGAKLKHSDAWADLDGPAFKAYYHESCGMQANAHTED